MKNERIKLISGLNHVKTKRIKVMMTLKMTKGEINEISEI